MFVTDTTRKPRPGEEHGKGKHAAYNLQAVSKLGQLHSLHIASVHSTAYIYKYLTVVDINE